MKSQSKSMCDIKERNTEWISWVSKIKHATKKNHLKKPIKLFCENLFFTFMHLRYNDV